MKVNLAKIAILTVTLAVYNHLAWSQGFINLNFEHPIPPLMPDQSFQVPASDGVPGWTVYEYGSPSSTITYNTLSAGSADVSLQGPGSLEPVLQGNYTVLLQGSSAGTPGGAAIGQNGQVPLNSESLRFYGYDIVNLQVTFGGQPLSYAAIGTGPNYTIYGADISAYAGQTGQLLFTALPHDEAFLDNIIFSAVPIPEPGTCALILCGAAAFGIGKRKFKV